MNEDTQLLDYIDAFVKANVVDIPGTDVRITLNLNGVAGVGTTFRGVLQSIRDQTWQQLVTAKLLGVLLNRVDPIL